jgi:hypothetical protein
MAFSELDSVVLLKAVPEHRLAAGDAGTVVAVYEDGAAYEVEFITLDGTTAAVLTLDRGAIRAAEPGEISHARQLD